MKFNKKVISNLSKCYSIAPLVYNGKEYFLVAAEKVDRCILFDTEGNEIDTIWNEPGGVMSMVQVPGSNGQFLATHKFYSPNDSKEAKIIIATPKSEGEWEIRTLVDLPHVHRFDILSSGGINYLIACTLKSGHEYKNDWSMPGKVYAAVLPEDLSGFSEANQLHLEVIKDGMLKNHGYYRVMEDETMTAVISSENGVFQFYPPENGHSEWKIEQVLDTPASDAVLVDFDQDGQKELLVLSPFHGNQISIYKKSNGVYNRIYDYGKKTEFLHAIYGGNLYGEPVAIIGHREEERSLIIIRYDKNKETYQPEVIDKGCGPANVMKYTHDGKEVLIAANREIDEVAMYIITKSINE